MKANQKFNLIVSCFLFPVSLYHYHSCTGTKQYGFKGNGDHYSNEKL
jgi:hypothetical protein